MPNNDIEQAYEDFASRLLAIDEEYYEENIPPLREALRAGLEHLANRYGLSSREYQTVMALYKELN